MYTWKVVPLCKEQLLDIDPKDVIPGGHFRLCDTYKSGGGYDKFASIFEKRTGKKVYPRQFVVQLYGCHLKCHYCYVTPNGIWGKPAYYTTDGLAKAFFTTQKMLRNKFHLDTFHLMGGSPALYIEHWPELIDRLGEDTIFHSDILLTEKVYKKENLKMISRPNCLYAVNIKGVSLMGEDYEKNTGCKIDWTLFWHNLTALVLNEVPFYLTFTNPDVWLFEDFVYELESHCGKDILEDMILIDLIDYKAVKAYESHKRAAC